MNRKKILNSDARGAIAARQAEVICRQHPDWSLQQVNDAAYRFADKAIKNGEARVS